MTSAPGSASDLNRITTTIIAGAIEVHRALGPGLLESAYLACLCYELTLSKLRWESNRKLPVVYKGVRIDCGDRFDLMVEGAVIVEVKALERLAPIHVQQLYSYLRLSGCCVGLLLNFGASTMKQGIKRIVHHFPLE